MEGIQREYGGNIEGILEEHRGNMEGIWREYGGNNGRTQRGHHQWMNKNEFQWQIKEQRKKMVSYKKIRDQKKERKRGRKKGGKRCQLIREIRDVKLMPKKTKMLGSKNLKFS